MSKLDPYRIALGRAMQDLEDNPPETEEGQRLHAALKAFVNHTIVWSQRMDHVADGIEKIGRT